MLSLIAQKQGPPFHILWSTHFRRKVIPVASDIKIYDRIRHYFPDREGDASGQRLAPPLHGTLTPGRISAGRPPFGRTGVSLSPTESSQNSLPQTAFGQMGTAGHLIFGRFDRSGVRDILLLAALLLQVVLAHLPVSLASLVERPRQ